MTQPIPVKQRHYEAAEAWLTETEETPLSDLERLAEAFARFDTERTATLERENAALREALEPFAKAADIRLCGEWRDDQHFSQTDVGFHLTFGDLRRARTALGGQP